MLPLYLIISDFFNNKTYRERKREESTNSLALWKKIVAESNFFPSLFTGEGEAVTQHAGTDVIIYLSVMWWKNHS